MCSPTSVPTLFPDFVAQHSVCLGNGPPLPSKPRGSAPEAASRQTEFLAGRYCAGIALGRLSPESPRAVVGIGPGSAPIWPQGFVGSISHSKNLVSAVVARAQVADGIGFDIEDVMTQRRPCRDFSTSL